jgi:hypothetical protein
MEQLEIAIRKAEADFIKQVHTILSTNTGTTTKIALIYKQYVRCQVALDDLISEAKLEPKPLYSN